MKLIKVLLATILTLTVGCASAKPVKTSSYSDGWNTVSGDNWSFKLPPSFYAQPSTAPETKTFRSLDGYIGVSFSTEDTKYDLENYSSAIAVSLEQDSTGWSGRQGKVDGKDAILIVAYAPSSTVFHVSIVERSRAYNFNCVVSNATDDDGTICGKICKTIKIK